MDPGVAKMDKLLLSASLSPCMARTDRALYQTLLS